MLGVEGCLTAAALRWQDEATPLHRSAAKDRVEVARALLEAGADKEAKDKVRHGRVC